MATKVYTIDDFSLSSTWVVDSYPPGHPNEASRYISSGPTTASAKKTVSFTDIPAGSTINSAIMTATVGKPLTGVSVRSVDKKYFDGSALEVGAAVGDSKTYEFKFRANGDTSKKGDRTSSQTFSNIQITVNYTLPYTKCSAPTSVSVPNNVAPGTTQTLSWSGAKAGTNLTIAGYQVYRASTENSNYTAFGSQTNSTSMEVAAHSTIGSSYYYKVVAIASISGYNSDMSSATATLTTTVGKTGAPTAVSISATNVAPGAEHTLSWSGGTAGTNNAITGYQVYRASTENSAYVALGSKQGATTTSMKVVSHATNGSSYHYKVATVGTYSGYDSAQSTKTASMKTYWTAVSAPTAVSVSANNVAPSSNHTLSWSGAGAGTNNSISGYDVYRSTSAGSGYALLGSTTSASYTITSGGAGTTYYYKVLAKGARGLNSALSTAYGTLTTSVSKASAPTTVSVNVTNALPSTDYTLSWSGAKNGTNNAITKYSVYRSTSSAEGYAWLADSTGTSLTVKSHSSIGGIYYYKVVAVGTVSGYNSDISTAYATMKTNITAVSAPTNFSFNSSTIAPATNYTLSWSGHKEGINTTISSFKVYRSTSAASGYTLLGTSTSASYTVVSNSAGNTYYYKVKAIANRTGYDSALSSSYATLTTPVSAATAPTTVAVSSNNVLPGASINLSWSGAKGGTNNPITTYEIYRSTSPTSGYVLLGTKTASPYAVSAHSTVGGTYYYKVLAKGTIAGYDSAQSTTYATLTATITAVATPTAPTGAPVVFENNPTFSWGASAAGTNNPVAKYSGEWQKAVSGGSWAAGGVFEATAPNYTLPATSVERGVSVRFRVMAVGTRAGYDSGWSSYSVALTRNSLPTKPTIAYGKTGTTIYNTKPYFSVSVGAEPNGQAQTLQVGIDGGSYTNLKEFGASGGTHEYRHTAVLAAGAHTFTFRVVDVLGAAGAVEATTITVATPTFTDTNLKDKPVKAQHVVELRGQIDNVRNFYGLAAFAWSENVAAGVVVKAAHFTQLQQALRDCANLSGATISLTAVARNQRIAATTIEQIRSAIPLL